MRFLIFRKINGDKGFFTTKQGVGQCERSFGFTGAAGAGQQEYPPVGRSSGVRPVLAARSRCAMAQSAGLCPTTRFSRLFSILSRSLCSSPEQGMSGMPVQSATTVATARASTSSASSGAKALMRSQLLLQFSAVHPVLTQRHNLLRQCLFLLILRFQMPGFACSSSRKSVSSASRSGLASG